MATDERRATDELILVAASATTGALAKLATNDYDYDYDLRVDFEPVLIRNSSA